MPTSPDSRCTTLPWTSWPVGCASTTMARKDLRDCQAREGREAVMSTVSAQRLARIFVEVADTMVDEFDLIEFLQMLADRTAALLSGSTVGLLLADPKGRLRFMAASDETTELLELFQ